MNSSGCERTGVSPVVGIMLMLTLVIILVAVISGFSGGIAGNSNSGSLIEITAGTKIINSGYANTSKFVINILSVSSPVSTKDLKLKTSWAKYDSGGGTLSNDTASTPDNFITVDGYDLVPPIGTGTGLPGWNGTSVGVYDNMSFGNYALMGGTRMVAYPADEYGEDTQYEYSDFSGTDCMQAVLGNGWNELRSGDVVTVMLIHVPSGRIIYTDDIYVNT